MGMDKSGMDMDIDIDSPGMDMDMDMLDMDMDNKAVSHIYMGLQPKAADCSLHHVQSAETRHALGSHDDQDHHVQDHHVQDRHVQDRHVRGHHGLDRLRAHLVVAVILALQVSSFSGSLTFLYS